MRTASAAFSRKGFSGVTMEEIGDDLEVTKGSLYYYFRSKQDLLYFCQKSSLRRLLEEAERTTRSTQPVTMQLYELIVSQIRCMLDELQGFTAHAEFRALPEDQLQEIIQKRDQYEAVLRGLVEKGMEEEIFLPGNPRIVVWAILGAINWTVQWYTPTGPLSAQEIGHEFALFLVRGLTRVVHLGSLPARTQVDPAYSLKDVSQPEG
ncbi:MAG: TetR/AcrR family transcriptional regulator [Acidobacteria bacterium]|nr:TetR/AcrR family transcriptional regulator [Acidobacteriota bacterium]